MQPGNGTYRGRLGCFIRAVLGSSVSLPSNERLSVAAEGFAEWWLTRKVRVSKSESKEADAL